MKKKIKIFAARNLRRRQTEAERVLWKEIRARKFTGVKFRRQHVIKGFIVDFYCPEKRIAIELDGGIHLKNKESDKERQEILEDMGIKVIRFSNNKILMDIKKVLDDIQDIIVSS